HLQQQISARTRTEFSLTVTLPTGLNELPNVPLTGTLDRLDFDESGQLLQVVDYKTGKPKTKRAIVGETVNSDGSYKRQLIFYALLLSLYEDPLFQCRTGVLSFVESTNQGVKEELFKISDEEIAALKGEIISSVETLLSGSWLQDPCDEEASSYCHLAAKLQNTSR
ncbi:MAG: PD-(D/E)XK nuclease family protein, partial [Bacteroidota bacterium]